ncbi:MAG: nuclear transport factor 2 family protein [Terrimicrobiaceae bacterium]
MIKFIMVLGLVVALAGCGTPRGEGYPAEFQKAATATPGANLSSSDGEAAIARFRGFFENVTTESIRKETNDLYAEDVWFNDTLKTLRGRAAVEAYFLKTMEHVDSFQTKVDDVARSGSDFYVRWTMDIRFKGAKEPVRTIGVTLLRFDRDGRAVLHQDFWDPAAGFYEHLPVLGGVMRWIKSKI